MMIKRLQMLVSGATAQGVTTMRHTLVTTVLLATVLHDGGCSDRASPAPPERAAPSDRELVQRGEQLVRQGGCADCHTPMRLDPQLGMPIPIRERALSGHPEGAPEPSASPGSGDQAVIGPTFTSFKTPFGVVFSSNLTPDDETGLGRWSAAQFIAALRTGKHGGERTNRPILPPMPWANIGSSSDDDLSAMFRYLQSVAPIKNRVTEPRVAPEALRAIARSHELAAATHVR